jgi:hypothetical protein
MTENPIPWRVIRAAPDMLEALEKIAAMDEIDGIDGPFADIARPAIDKAKGETRGKERECN